MISFKIGRGTAELRKTIQSSCLTILRESKTNDAQTWRGDAKYIFAPVNFFGVSLSVPGKIVIELCIKVFFKKKKNRPGQ